MTLSSVSGLSISSKTSSKKASKQAKQSKAKEMEKSQRQRSSSSSPPAPPSEITHHFFKVYMPSFCRYSLKIPITFMMKLNGVIFEKVILKDPLKRLWQVEVTRVKGVFYFQNGWEEFVKGNCLKMGEFLVFQYAGNSAFYVDIFDNSECEKKFKPKLNKTNTPSVNEEEVESESDDQTSSYSDYLPSEGEVCEEEIYKSKRSSVSNGEMEGVSNPDGFIESKLPHFVVSLRDTISHKQSLHIPNKLVKRDDIDIKPKMVLRDPSQRSWPVNIIFSNDRTTFGKGWFDFWKRNNLQPGDQCMFEFNKCKVKGRDKNSNVINVKVVRATRKRPSAPHKT